MARKKKREPKKGTGKKPKGSSRRLYTDENPNDTVSVKFRTVTDIRKTLAKKSFKSKSHKRQSQIINLIHQRSRAAYKNAKDPKVKARLKKAFDYAIERKEASKRKTKRMNKSKKNETFIRKYVQNIITENTNKSNISVQKLNKYFFSRPDGRIQVNGDFTKEFPVPVQNALFQKSSEGEFRVKRKFIDAYCDKVERESELAGRIEKRNLAIALRGVVIGKKDGFPIVLHDQYFDFDDSIKIGQQLVQRFDKFIVSLVKLYEEKYAMFDNFVDCNTTNKPRETKGFGAALNDEELNPFNADKECNTEAEIDFLNAIYEYINKNTSDLFDDFVKKHIESGNVTEKDLKTIGLLDKNTKIYRGMGMKGDVFAQIIGGFPLFKTGAWKNNYTITRAEGSHDIKIVLKTGRYKQLRSVDSWSDNLMSAEVFAVGRGSGGECGIILVSDTSSATFINFEKVYELSRKIETIQRQLSKKNIDVSIPNALAGIGRFSNENETLKLGKEKVDITEVHFYYKHIFGNEKKEKQFLEAMKKGFAKVKGLDPDLAAKAFAKNCKLAIKK